MEHYTELIDEYNARINSQDMLAVKAMTIAAYQTKYDQAKMNDDQPRADYLNFMIAGGVIPCPRWLYNKWCMLYMSSRNIANDHTAVRCHRYSSFDRAGWCLVTNSTMALLPKFDSTDDRFDNRALMVNHILQSMKVMLAPGVVIDSSNESYFNKVCRIDYIPALNNNQPGQYMATTNSSVIDTYELPLKM